MLIVAAGCALFACNGLPGHEEFAIGMDRSAVRERFGEPLRSHEMRKTDDAVWGPIEDFWSRVPMGSAVEIWSYPTTHEWAEGSGQRDTGITELYFVDGSDEVAARGFAPGGVVYEAAPPPAP
jgi:hypothetical protein